MTLIVLSSLPANAQFKKCPKEDGRRVCQISTERSTLTVVTSGGRGPEVEIVSWIIDGVEHMGTEGIRVRDGSTGRFPSFDLFSAETVSDTVQILIFHELDNIGLSSNFALRQNDEQVWVDLEIHLSSSSGSAEGQVFLVSDLDLDGDPDDLWV